MKIALCSDIHLEFGDLPIENTENADVLVLAGDICVAAGFTRTSYEGGKYHEFFKKCSEQFRDVIFIMGNHEHYNGDYCTSYQVLKTELEEYPNIHFLEKEFKIINGVMFIGATLWTDFNNQDAYTMQVAERQMNDYRIIKNSLKGRRLIALDTLYDHQQTLEKITDFYNAHDLPVVMVGHHAPSHKSVKPRYERDREMNGAYRSDLEQFITDKPRIALWVHGHTHSEFDYMVGTTRVVANPRGYMGYERGSHEKDPYYPKVIELFTPSNENWTLSSPQLQDDGIQSLLREDF